MATSTARPSGSPIISWDKAQQQLRPTAKKNNPIMFIAIAAVVLLAATGIWRIANKPAPGRFIQVMAARTNIQPGTRIGIMSVNFFDVPKQYATADMVTSLNDVAGHIARTFIPAGEPIQASMLFPINGGVSRNIDSTERAITLQLDDDALIDHSIMPDDRVDVLVVSNKDGKKYTKTIGQALRVLMSAPKEQLLSRGSTTGTNKITLAVSPVLAESLTEAADTGKIRLVLRNRLSRTEQTLAGATPENLLPTILDNLKNQSAKTVSELVPPPPAVASLIPPPTFGPLQWMVEVISGNHKDHYAVPEK